MSRAPEGSDRQTRAAYLRWEGKSFVFIAAAASGLGYRSADEAEGDYIAFMEFRKIVSHATR